MDHAPLRPVPARPTGPVDPAALAALVAATLPDAGEPTVHALAAVVVGRPRAEVAAEIEVDEETLAGVLAAGRKALRKTLTALPGSGWCERAERLISDRLDGDLGQRERGLLDVHLRNCPRCVEHERRLVQATDGLLAGVYHGDPAEPPAPPARAAPPLALVTETLPEASPPPPSRLAVGAYAVVVAGVVLALAGLVLGLAGVF